MGGSQLDVVGTKAIEPGTRPCTPSTSTSSTTMGTVTRPRQYALPAGGRTPLGHRLVERDGVADELACVAPGECRGIAGVALPRCLHRDRHPPGATRGDAEGDLPVRDLPGARTDQTWTTSASSVRRALVSWTSQPSQSSTVKVRRVVAAALRWSGAGAAPAGGVTTAAITARAVIARAVVRRAAVMAWCSLRRVVLLLDAPQAAEVAPRQSSPSSPRVLRSRSATVGRPRLQKTSRSTDLRPSLKTASTSSSGPFSQLTTRQPASRAGRASNAVRPRVAALDDEPAPLARDLVADGRSVRGRDCCRLDGISVEQHLVTDRAAIADGGGADRRDREDADQHGDRRRGCPRTHQHDCPSHLPMVHGQRSAPGQEVAKPRLRPAARTDWGGTVAAWPRC